MSTPIASVPRSLVDEMSLILTPSSLTSTVLAAPFTIACSSSVYQRPVWTDVVLVLLVAVMSLRRASFIVGDRNTPTIALSVAERSLISVGEPVGVVWARNAVR